MKQKLIVNGIIIVVLALALASALGFFDNKPYKAIPHGNHKHYVPNDRNPDTPLHEFPQQLPPPGLKIAPDGKIVPE